MKETVIIVAGGSGSRMQSQLPKQFIEINGEPILMHTIRRFYEYNSKIDIRLVLPESQIKFWLQILPHYNFNIPCKIYKGGATRFQSVKNALVNIDKNSLVAIHDGVRPFVSLETIKNSFATASKKGSAIPVVDVVETVRQIESGRSKTVNRDNFKLVQTPQTFNADVILSAYNQEFQKSFTDDASVVEANGFKITLIEGNRENIKITTQIDLLIAQAYMGKTN
jgi:2-C-methyl-D-erythritol 4-phosphate cytidylyltransferase